MLKIGAASLLFFAVIFSAHTSPPRNDGGGLKRILSLCGQSLVHAESFVDLHANAKASEAAIASAKKYEASTRTLKNRLIPYFQGVVRALKFQFKENPFNSGKNHKEVAFDLALSLLEHASVDQRIHSSLAEPFRRIFEVQHKDVGDNLHLVLDSNLGNTNDVLRFIVMSAPAQNLFFIRLEYRNKESGIIRADDSNSLAPESINVEVYKDYAGKWKGIATHNTGLKKLGKINFKLDETVLAANGITSEIVTPRIFEIRSEADESEAQKFLLEHSDDKGKSPFPGVFLLPQIPKDSSKAAQYRSLLKAYGAFAHQIKFSSYKTLSNFLKRFLKKDLADVKNVPENLISDLMQELDDGLPVLLVTNPTQNYLISPSHFKDGVPTDHDVAAGLAYSFNDFAEHGRIAHQVHENAHDSLLRAAKRREEASADENRPAEEEETDTQPPKEETSLAEVTPPLKVEELSPKSQAEILLEKALLELAQERERAARLEAELQAERAASQSKAEELALELSAADEAKHLAAISELEGKLRHSRGAEMNLQTKVKQFQEAGGLTPAQLQKLRSLEAKGMRTVSNAVQLAEALHPGSFELTKQAADQLSRLSVSDAKDQYFAQEMYSSLVSLWHVLWAPDAPVIREQKQTLFKQLSGLEIAFDETAVTKEKLRAQKERTFLYGDKEFVAWPHIKLSNSRRIYFAIDSENRRTLIYSWPDHLWTQVDGSSK